MEGKWLKGRRTFVAVVFVAVVIAHIITHVARAPCVGHVACVGHTTSVGVHVWVDGTLVRAVVCWFMKLEACSLSLLKSMMMVVLMRKVICLIE